jgi:hypothetical protein
MGAGVGETALGRWFMWLAIIGIVLLLLIYGRPFLLPIVVAFLVFTVFSAAIDKVSRIRLGGIALPYWLATTAGLVVFAVVGFRRYGVMAGGSRVGVGGGRRRRGRRRGGGASVAGGWGEEGGGAVGGA